MKLRNKVQIILIISLFVSAGLAYATSFILMRFYPQTDNPEIRRMSIFLLREIMAITIFVVFIFLGTNKITKPITALTEATGKIADGNYIIDIAIPKNRDEMSTLTRNFIKMADQLQKNEYMAKDFIQNASHEFKTPLATLMGYVQILGNNTLTQENRKQCVGLAVEEIDRLSGITTDILLLSKLESQSSLPPASIFSLDEQLRQVILSLEPRWSDKSISVETDLSECRYQGYEELIEKVWFNLIDNAIKFTSDGGRISVALNYRRGCPCVVISDNGIGMTAADKARIFERFFQCDNSRNGMGAGLGLSIVKRIVALHNGSIQVQSEPQQGTVFTVTLDKSHC